MNPNDIVEIKPTEAGWQEILKSIDETNDDLRKNPRVKFRLSVPKADKDGYIRGQFWLLMEYFNWQQSIGGDVHFSDLRPVRHALEEEPIAPVLPKVQVRNDGTLWIEAELIDIRKKQLYPFRVIVDGRVKHFKYCRRIR